VSKEMNLKALVGSGDKIGRFTLPPGFRAQLASYNFGVIHRGSDVAPLVVS
jgi:hypothetical protein